MSAAAAAETAPAGAGKKGKKKLLIMIVALLVVVLAGGGAAVFMMKKKAADAEAAEGDDEGAAPAHHAAKVDPKHPPTFLPLEPFVVNLADKEAERYAQIGVTLEIDDAHFAEEMKTYMPAIRNSVLMILAHKTSQQLLERAGKESLAAEIQREAVRPLGIEIEPEDDDEAADKPAKADDGEHKPKKKKKRKKAAEHNPVTRVLFSNFIVQ